MACFNYVEFDRRYSPGLTGGPSFSTVKVVSATGQEQRIRQWVKGRWKYDVSELLRKPAQAAALQAFFLAMGGSQCGFLFYDWTDYSSAVGGVETKHATAQLTSTTFQLQKVYDASGITYARTITKPIADTLGEQAATPENSTVRLYDSMDAEVTSGWTVDCRTGIVTFVFDPGFVPTAQYQFDVPVRFDTDEMTMQQDNPNRFNWSKIGLVELR